jgi:hypothetical protein
VINFTLKPLLPREEGHTCPLNRGKDKPLEGLDVLEKRWTVDPVWEETTALAIPYRRLHPHNSHNLRMYCVHYFELLKCRLHLSTSKLKDLAENNGQCPLPELCYRQALTENNV